MAALNLENPSTPVAACSVWEDLYTTNGAEKALAASGDWTRGDSRINVRDARWLLLWAAYDGAAASGYAHVVVMVSNAQDCPAVDDDSWFVPGTTDMSNTDVTIDSGLPAGTDFSAESFGEITMKPALVKVGPAAAGATTEVRHVIPVNVSHYRWAQVMVAEKGATGSPGSLLLRYSTSL